MHDVLGILGFNSLHWGGPEAHDAVVRAIEEEVPLLTYLDPAYDAFVRLPYVTEAAFDRACDAALREHAITPIAYSSLVPLSTWRAADGEDSAKQAEWAAEAEASDFVFAELAARHGVSEAQVLLRWAIQHGYPVIPKSVRRERLRSNIDIFGFELAADDMALIDTLDRGAGVAWQWGDPLTYA